MSLDALPTELISRICRYLGIEIIVSSNNQPLVINNLRDFTALRSTCKDLYRKTEYDATIRYARRLEGSSVSLKESSLRKSLAVFKIPRFHARIRYISLPSLDAYDEAESDLNFEDGGSAQEPESPSYMVDAKPRQEMERREADREIELSDEPQNIGELKDLLLQFFQVLNAAPKLEDLRLSPDLGFDLVLGALVAAKFTRKIVNLTVDPFFLTTVGPKSQWDSPHTFSPHVRGLLLSTPISQDGYPACGSHYRGFRPTTLRLNRLIQALTALDCLEIQGCRPWPELRLCHGCDDLFTRNFAPMRYPHLSKLRMESFLISGGRLRAFIKRHAQSLRNVEFEFVTLTDGSWRSIAQGLAKLSFITKLDLAHLHQKHPSDHHDQSRDLLFPTHRVLLEDAAHTTLFLEMIVENFRTINRFSQDRLKRIYPKYYEVKLFQLPDATVTAQPAYLERDAELLRYAQMS